MDFLKIKSIHFTGIKGVGMTAAAIYCADRGIDVQGSDLAEEFVTDSTLKRREIHPKVGFSLENVDSGIDLLVYTGAHNGPNNPEVVWAKEQGISTYSLGEAIKIFQQGKDVISVCGVGGKTSTSAMLSVLFENAGKNPSFMVGVASISGLDFPGKFTQLSKDLILEADEYATSPGVDHTPRFMHQDPQMIVCTNIAHDHPDIYPSLDDTIKAYHDFFQKLPENGTLIINSDCQNSIKLVEDMGISPISIGRNEKSDYQIISLDVEKQIQTVTFKHQNQEFSFQIKVPGEFNAKNALMAYAAAKTKGLSHEEIVKGLPPYGGVNRRFESKGMFGSAQLLDDYAHHPQEIKATLKAAKDWFPGKKIQVIFQPHTYSRTKALFDEFVDSFANADSVILTNIFPSAREKIDSSISSQMLADEIVKTHPNTHFVSRENLVKYLINQRVMPDVIITMGAGDVYKIHSQLK